MKITKKRIVITGGTSGIGYEMVKLLHSENEVIVIARNAMKLNKLELELPGVVTYQADLSQATEVEVAANKILERFKSLDILINNVAVQYTPTFLDDDFQYSNIADEVALNFTNICHMTYWLLPALMKNEKSHERTIILNINSGLGFVPKTSSAVYCATKAALDIFSQSLSYQLEQTNVRVQQAFLELVDTPMTAGRGTNKMSPKLAAQKIIYGIENDISINNIGKVKLLRVLLRLVPSIAKRIMKKY
jgi:uncharacterized oxidoreductase